MNILILGCGTVGLEIARFLHDNKHDVTVVERDAARIERYSESLDVRFVEGKASLASVLKEAGAASCHLCLALTSETETNLVACAVAKSMGAKRCAARVYSDVFHELQYYKYRDCFNIDRFFGIEFLTAMEIARMIRDPGSMMIEHFAQGQQMQEVIILRESGATGKPLKSLKLPGTVRIGSINRDGKVTIASADDTVNPGDRVTFLGEAKSVEEVKKQFVTAPIVKRSVLIAGGGEVAFNLALVLQNRNYVVHLIESDKDRVDYLSQKLMSTTVLRGDVLRRSTLEEEQVSQFDYFVAATGNDEDNVMCCIEAKSLQAKKTIAVVKHTDYAGLVKKFGIDVTVSPNEVMQRQVEGLLHTGALVFSNPNLLGNGIEVVELVSEEGAPITEVPLKECRLPGQALIASVVRGKDACLPNADFLFKPGDIAIALVFKDQKERLVELFTNPVNSQSKKTTLFESIFKTKS